MNSRRNEHWTRRDFLKTAAFAGTGAFLGFPSEPHAAEPPLETTKLRLAHSPAICVAPNYIAEELLPGEGFTDIRYVRTAGGLATMKAVASGQVDLSMLFSGPSLIQIDRGDPIVILAGIHVGCFELFGSNRIRSVRDLKGKTAAVLGLGTSPHVFLASMVSYVGLDPHKDINWVTHPAAESIRLLAEGKIDAFMAFPPEPQELRVKKIGHVLINSMMDRPWSQYFCCMVAANKEFVRKSPTATKRALRAILKATDITAREPERVARFLVDRGYMKNYDYALQAMKEIPYGMWREFDPEDTVRFYSLRLNEIGMIKSSPQKIISQGTDWRFLRELKKELKA